MSSPAAPPAELFLSHASEDRAFATALAGVVRRHGIPVWYSDTDIVGAQQWHDEIGRALKRCDWFAVVLSPRAVDQHRHPWVKREVLYALNQNHFEERVIPILLEPCDSDRLSWVLSILERVDFNGTTFEAGCRQLLRIWGIGYRAPER